MCIKPLTLCFLYAYYIHGLLQQPSSSTVIKEKMVIIKESFLDIIYAGRKMLKPYMMVIVLCIFSQALKRKTMYKDKIFCQKALKI